MADRRPPDRVTALLVASGVADWLMIIGAGIGAYYLGKMTPNKRPFQLENPDISFPYTVNETISSQNLIISTVGVPIVTIIVVSLFVTPGRTVPPGTPTQLVWRRRLWELYASLLSYAVGMIAQYFIINALKNVCGKPRPDLISRCQPDLDNLSRYIVGGIANITSNGQLVSADICQNTDASILNDGFRSYPSGHSASSAAGLGHLALWLAHKLGVVFPSAAPPVYADPDALAAFPSRAPASGSRPQRDVYELVERRSREPSSGTTEYTKNAYGYDMNGTIARAPSVVSARRSGAAPPLYLLVFVLVPFGASVFIAASRWFNYRHHGFDILFGYSIGIVTSIVAFRLYQLPMRRGAGWAWGPRAADKAFWAGVGCQGWAETRRRWSFRGGDEEAGRLAEPVEGYRSASSPPEPPVHKARRAPEARNLNEE